MRAVPKSPARGSLKWIQQAVNVHADIHNSRIVEALKQRLAPPIRWASPLASDDYAEYRDRAALEQVNFVQFEDRLRAFWPSRGPQWDALAVAGEKVLLVEAKANVLELVSPG